MGRQFSPVYGNPAQDPLAEVKAQIANVHRYLIEQGHDATNASQAAQGASQGTANAVAGITGDGGGLIDKLKESQIVWDPVGGHNHASGNSTPVPLSGDLSGTNQAAVVVQSAGNFLVNGVETIAQLDAGGGADVPALRPSFLNLRHRTVAATVPGVGGTIDWTVPDSVGADQTVASLAGEITGVVAGAIEGTVGVVVKHQNQNCEVMRWRGQGGMAATAATALQGFVGGEAWCRGNFRVEGTGGQINSITDAGTTTTDVALTLEHLSSGAAAAGLGVELDWKNQGSSGSSVVTGWAQSLYTGGGAGAENGTFIWGALYGGVRMEAVRLRGGVGMAVAGGVGGQTWIRNDLLHSGNSLSFFNGTQVTQQAGASAAGIAAITDPNAKAALTALQAAIGAAGCNLITSPA